MKEFENLRDELIAKRGEIYTNQLTMSVGEIINLYENDEINLEPAFQRLFRWDAYQETNFIESILLGYPIPAIFVLQREDGIWDVIDGVQRLSTIYHFVGILKNYDGKSLKPLKLETAKILTKLEGKYYNNKEYQEDSIDVSTRIDFKRSSFPIILLKYGSEQNSKYELFKRLNTGGTHLSKQEIRNALILMSNEDVYQHLDEYSKDPEFQNVLNIPDGKKELRMDMDILTRFIVMRNYDDLEGVSNSTDINEFLDMAIMKIISAENYDIRQDLDVMRKLITFLKESVDEEYGFRKYDKNKNKFTGSFNWFVFETLIWGVTVINDISILKDKENMLNRIKELTGVGEYQEQNGLSNLKVIQRLKEAKNQAKRIFSKDE